MHKVQNSKTQMIANPWFTYFLNLIRRYWNKLKIPVLAINGNLDVQVLCKQNLAGISLEKQKKF
jgi:hypothetical protein